MFCRVGLYKQRSVRELSRHDGWSGGQSDSNRKQHPNENLARELMELFSMGVGNYTETDVKEAARALTGWTIKHGKTCWSPQHHDGGEKTILGQTGSFDGDDLVQLVLAHPSTPRRIARRLCELFFGEGALSDAAIDELATGLRNRDLDVHWGVATILQSEAFFSE